MRYLPYIIIQLTWGIIQSLAGFFVFLACSRRKHCFFHGAVLTEWNSMYSLSLGMFIFVSSPEKVSPETYRELCLHEYGHTIQSLFLGPLYVPLISIPSMIWCVLPYFDRYRAENNVGYYDFHVEKGANVLAERVLHEKVI